MDFIAEKIVSRREEARLRTERARKNYLNVSASTRATDEEIEDALQAYRQIMNEERRICKEKVQDY